MNSVSGGLALRRGIVAFGYKCRTTGTAGPGQRRVGFGGSLDKTLDKAGVGFHVVHPQISSMGL